MHMNEKKKPSGFLKLSKKMIENGMRPLDAKVYSVICELKAMRTGTVFATNSTIAKKVKSSSKSVSNAITRLQKEGFIQCVFKENNPRKKRIDIEVFNVDDVYKEATDLPPNLPPDLPPPVEPPFNQVVEASSENPPNDGSTEPQNDGGTLLNKKSNNILHNSSTSQYSTNGGPTAPPNLGKLSKKVVKLDPMIEDIELARALAEVPAGPCPEEYKIFDIELIGLFENASQLYKAKGTPIGEQTRWLIHRSKVHPEAIAMATKRFIDFYHRAPDKMKTPRTNILAWFADWLEAQRKQHRLEFSKSADGLWLPPNMINEQDRYVGDYGLRIFVSGKSAKDRVETAFFREVDDRWYEIFQERKAKERAEYHVFMAEQEALEAEELNENEHENS